MRNRYERKTNYLYKRYVFNKTLQDSNESTQQFLGKLRSLASKCVFSSYLEERIRDQFILGLRVQEIQKEIFTRFSAVDGNLSQINELVKDLENAKNNNVKIREDKAFGEQINRITKFKQNDNYNVVRAEKRTPDPNYTCLR